ncbi:TRAP transporter large permease [Marinobacter sp. 2_MG-2023]|uniref:TRAP transporter large permease n=1 Tax=Marinobacter sp. 2_MG-2023 TaxID=3062679 RepID=UPI0026E2A9F5|nr:TRAP transporter large permease [Marinobacter sp. 2_MG-2023]MDO6441436.1 TRAP transporter large permease [Marinobacter sp. 2_MG-2023]
MSNLEIGLWGIGILIVLVLLRAPLGLALLGTSFIGISVMISERSALGLLASTPYDFVASWSLSSIPMFLLMGYLAYCCSLTDGLFKLARKLLSWLPGGLGIATIAGSGLFAAVSGSSVACSATMGRVAVPEMNKAGYQPGFSGSIVAIGGTVGSMIPPSIVMIIYGVFTQVSIAKLFIAGILPGLLSMAIFSLVIIARVKLNPSLAPRESQGSTPDTWSSAILETWPMVMLICVVLGGIFSGAFTATEAGGVGAAITALIAVFRRALSWRRLGQALVETLKTTSTVFLIAIGATLFTRFLALSGVPDYMTNVALSLSDSPLTFIIGVSVVFLVLGMFLEPIGIMLLTLPLLLPIFNHYEIDLIWMGILVVKYLEISLVTPPIGMNLFVVKTVMGSGLNMGSLLVNTFWFVVAEMFILGLLIGFPSISLWLPSFLD